MGAERAQVTPRQQILAEIAEERDRQDDEWGGVEHDDKHGPGDWVVLIMKHLGRAATALTEPSSMWQMTAFRRALVVTAALAVAGLEWADRNWPDNRPPRERDG